MNIGHTLSIARDLAYRLSFKPLFSQYYSIKLEAPDGMENVVPSIQYIGDGSQLAYLKSLFSEQALSEHSRCTLKITDILRKRWKTSTQALVIYDFDFPLHYILRLPGLAVPYWLKQKIELSDDWDAYLARMRRKTRREAQRMIRKFDLRTRVVAGNTYAEAFYDRLYAPYIRQRHGESAVVIDRQTALKKLRKSQIVQLLLDEQVIGAAQINIQGPGLLLGWTGLANLHDRPELRGVADALDMFCMKHAFDTGCQIIDMGHSRAVLSDGILRYKKKWGANVSAGVVPQGLMKFEVQDFSPACRHFLSNNPLLSVQNSELAAHVVLPEDICDEQGISSFVADHFIDGLTTMHIYCEKSIQAQLERVSVPCNFQTHAYDTAQQFMDLLNQ